MYSISDIADWFLSKEAISPKKLQKLVFYAYSWFLVFMNEDVDDLSNRLFDERAEAWIHGPVFPELYKKYKHFGYSEIPKVNEVKDFNPDVLDVLNQVWDVYGEYNANELESISHQESPWKNARNDCMMYEACNNKIDDRDIFMCYSERLGSRE